jgi:hypothetical protein
MSTRDQSTAPDAIPPISADIFQFVTVRPPRQVAADSPRASISPGLGRCSLADRLRKITAMRLGLRQTLRRAGERLWLLHAPSLLDGPGSAARDIVLPEDDYRRLAARRQRHHPHE